MLKQLSIVDLISAVQQQIEKNTKYKCYDFYPKKAKSPFYIAELYESVPNNSKTTYRTSYTLNIHAISSPSESTVELYDMIQSLDEALTEDIELPDGYQMVAQMNMGVNAIYYEEETDERHAVIKYQFIIAYGYIVKE